MAFRSFVFLILSTAFLSSCSYKFGYHQRDLPGGYNQVSVPVFTNSTDVVGIEGHFTNALVNRFNRSQVAKVMDKDLAPATIKGHITNVKVEHEGQIDGNSDDKNSIFLPRNTVLTSQYRMSVVTEVSLVRNSDKKILWQARFSNERVFKAPQVGLAGVNTANPLYTHSAKMDLIQQMAQDMMGDAHDRMTENF